MKQAVGLQWDNGAMNPGRMPWAGLSDAFGVSETCPGLHRAGSKEIRPAPNLGPRAKRQLPGDISHDKAPYPQTGRRHI